MYTSLRLKNFELPYFAAKCRDVIEALSWKLTLAPLFINKSAHLSLPNHHYIEMILSLHLIIYVYTFNELPQRDAQCKGVLP